MAPPSETAAAAAARIARVVIQENVTVDEHGMENIDQFWEAAKTPEKEAEEEEEQPEQQQVAASKPAVARKSPRFSLPGQQEEENDDLEDVRAKAGRLKSRLNKKGVPLTPSQLSPVYPAPPSPPEEEPVQEEEEPVQEEEEPVQEEEEELPPPPPEEEVAYSPPEAPRASPGEEEEEEVALPQASKSPAVEDTQPVEEEDAFPTNDDDDDDDMIPPPPPPEDEEEEDAYMTLPAGEDDGPATQEDVEFPTNDNDDFDDDDDKEGEGFAVIHDPETPESVREERARQEEEKKKKKRGRPKKKKDDDDDDESQPSKHTKKKRGRAKKVRDDSSTVATSPSSEPARKRVKKKKKVTYGFSPKGIPAGNREYKVVPVSNLKEEDEEDDGKRRSHRARCKPLAFWKNERPIYGPNDEENKAMGDMPVVKAIEYAEPTPYKKTNRGPRPANKKKKKRSRDEDDEKSVDDADVPFDSRKLRKKCKYSNGEIGTVWDESAQEASDLKIVAYAKHMTASKLPLPEGRSKSEGDVVGTAAQAFNIPVDPEGIFPGYIMGSLNLPPQGIKDPESSGECTVSFTVCKGQPKSIELALGDPDERDGTLRPKSAQRYLLGPGDMFRILPGNCYRLQNHSQTTDCLLSWTIIRPCWKDNDEE